MNLKYLSLVTAAVAAKCYDDEKQNPKERFVAKEIAKDVVSAAVH